MTVTNEAMAFFGSLPQNLKLAPVSIVGPISSGKSTLANLLLRQDKIFKAAQQTQGVTTTNGIYIWPHPIQISKDIGLILMDTQGIQLSQTTSSVSSLRSPRGSNTASLRSPRGLGSQTSKV